MSNTPHPEHDDTIDELASRLLDGDIELHEIDETQRSTVLARRDVFAVNRDRLRLETPLSPVATLQSSSRSRSRSMRYTVLGLAAAAVVGLVGVAITTQGDNDADMTSGALPAETASASDAAQSDAVVEMSTMSAATEAPAAASMAPAASPSASAAADASTAGGAASTKAFGLVEVCPDPVGRPVIYSGTYEGQIVEVHFSDIDGLVVYRTSDCGVVLGIVP